MANKKRRLDPNEHTKADLIRAVLTDNPDATERDIREFYDNKVKFLSSHISMVRTAWRKKQEREKAQTTLPTEHGNEEHGNEEHGAAEHGAAELLRLRDENRYLHWQLIGERLGFFERWLEENDT